jgi:hypothetical protein
MADVIRYLGCVNVCVCEQLFALQILTAIIAIVQRNKLSLTRWQ